MKLPLSRGAIAMILGACAIAAFALRASTGPEGDQGALAAPTRKDRVLAAVPPPDTPSDFSTKLDLLEARSEAPPSVRDLFGAPPPAVTPVVAAPVTPSKPSAPPFPYSYIGALEDSSGRTVYLSSADRVVLARTHQTIDGVYQVDRIESGALTVTYLPLHQTQTIALEQGR